MTDPSPPTTQDIISGYYDTHPGLHRCADVAHALTEEGQHVSTHYVALYSRRLNLRGLLTREQRRVPGWTRLLTLYGKIDQPATDQHEETPA